jgi:L-threonylcarbamoyladenylate synthase
MAAGEAHDAGAPRSPGRLLSHYAPDLPLRLHATEITETEALLAFGPPIPGAGLLFNLSEAGDLSEAAARLFAGLRWLDAQGRARGLRGIAAMAVPQTGLGVAINDRLNRAAFRS